MLRVHSSRVMYLCVFPYSYASHTSLYLSTFFTSRENILLIESKDVWPSRQCWSITLTSLSLATNAKAVNNASSLSCLSKFQQPLCLTLIPSLFDLSLLNYATLPIRNYSTINIVNQRAHRHQTNCPRWNISD